VRASTQKKRSRRYDDEWAIRFLRRRTGGAVVGPVASGALVGAGRRRPPAAARSLRRLGAGSRPGRVRRPLPASVRPAEHQQRRLRRRRRRLLLPEDPARPPRIAKDPHVRLVFFSFSKSSRTNVGGYSSQKGTNTHQQQSSIGITYFISFAFVRWFYSFKNKF